MLGEGDDDAATGIDHFSADDDAKSTARAVAYLDSRASCAVLLSACMCILLSCGPVFSSGVLYDELLRGHFGARHPLELLPSETCLSLLLGLQSGITFLVGPLSSTLARRFGHRSTTIMGALIACCANVGAFLSHDWLSLFLCLGLLSGIGFGLIVTPALDIPSPFFFRSVLVRAH